MKLDEFKTFVKEYFIDKGFEKANDAYYKRGEDVMVAADVWENAEEQACRVNLYFYLCELAPGYAPISEHLLSSAMFVRSRRMISDKTYDTAYIEYERYGKKDLILYFDNSLEKYVLPYLNGGKASLFKHIAGCRINPLKGKKYVRDALLSPNNFIDKNHFLEYCGKILTERGYKKKRKMLYYVYSKGVLSCVSFSSSVYGGHCYVGSYHYIGNYAEIKRSLPDEEEIVFSRGYHAPSFDDCTMEDVDKFFEKTFSDFLTPLMEEGVDWLLKDRNYRRFSPDNGLKFDEVEEILKKYRDENQE